MSQHAKFGYLPDKLDLTVGAISISTLPDFATSVRKIHESPRVQNDWIFDADGVRIFTMPQTHVVVHSATTDRDHVEFLVWVLSFFVGMRLTTTEAGFIDATPIKRQALVDFVFLRTAELGRALMLADDFWTNNAATPRQRKRWAGAVHLLFLAQFPHALQFERFLYLYTALDSCFAMLKTLSPPVSQVRHAERVQWMCTELGMPIPAWATTLPGNAAEIANMRNSIIHEGLYMGEPMGFALHDRKSASNLPLEMQHLISRFLVALIGVQDTAYVRSPVTSYQTQGLAL